MRILFLSSMSISIELLNDDCYYTKEYDVYLDDEFLFKNNTNTFSIYDLNPNQEYKLKINNEEIKFITLNKNIVLYNTNTSLQDVINNLRSNEVLVIDGICHITSLFLKDNIEIYLKEGSMLIGETDRLKYEIFKSTDVLNGIVLGTWEGCKDDVFKSPVNLLGINNVMLYGKGVIDCNANNSDFWLNHRVKNIARRPKGIFIHTSNNITFEGITVKNTASWNQHPFYSNNINYYNLKLINPKKSPTTDGIDPESCSNVNIIGCIISVGDDCIAIKSGKIDFAKIYHQPSNNILIRNCLMIDGHAGVTLGSEASSGINNVKVTNCCFSSTDRGLRIKTQRGRGKDTIIDNIEFNNIIMNNVLSCFVINSFYKAGNDIIDYRFDRNILEKNDLTPKLNNFYFKNIKCYNVVYGVGYFLGLPESVIDNITLENINITYSTVESKGIMAMTKEKEEFSKIGFYLENIDTFILKNVNFIDKPKEKFIVKNVRRVDEL